MHIAELVPLSVQRNFGFLPLEKIFSNARATVSPFLFCRVSIHPNLEKTSITVKRSFTPSFSSANFFISTKSAAQISSIPLEITFLFLNRSRIGLWSSSPKSTAQSDSALRFPDLASVSCLLRFSLGSVPTVFLSRKQRQDS